jgi:hypothetical protein
MACNKYILNLVEKRSNLPDRVDYKHGLYYLVVNFKHSKAFSIPMLV